MSTTKRRIPEGYMEDSRGSLTPLDLVKPVDLDRDKLVHELIKSAKKHSHQMSDFKGHAMKEIEDFISVSGQRYKVKMGGNKGNVTLFSYDGRFKITRAISESISFDERLQVAKELIDSCIHAWTQSSGSEIRALINNAFQVDKEGQVSTSRIIGLQRLDINDRKWKKAMQAITDSIQVAGSKTYLRFYERVGDSDQWKPISLDIAAA